jgi:hypothetical protein
MGEARQQIVDALARRLRRAVAIDDVHFRLLVYTAHDDEVDPRGCMILTRPCPDTEPGHHSLRVADDPR